MRPFHLFRWMTARNMSKMSSQFASIKPITRVLLASVPVSAACYYYYHQKLNQPVLVAAGIFSGFSKPKWMADPVTDKNTLMKDKSYCGLMERLCLDTQAQVCNFLQSNESEKKILVDKWYRQAGDGGGISCILEDGEVFERAGCNISVIRSQLSDSIVRMMRARVKSDRLKAGLPFFVCGVSCVVHPRNPHVPSMHFNFRYFEVSLGEGEIIWWFGGGTDLTPYYLEEADAKHFHQTLKDACDKHNAEYYPKFKEWCDKYFYLPHRGETRGVGGIFFDDLDKPNQKTVYDFVKSASEAVVPSFQPIVDRRKNQPYSEADRQWQLLRRGRYVEFNLVYDRGTKFGLATKDARIESILMSLPIIAKWTYAHDPSKEERQSKLMEVLKNPRDWV